MKADKKKQPSSETEKKQSGAMLLGFIFKFFKESLYPSELMKINECLYWANEITPSWYFIKLQTKNRLFWLVASAPSLLNLVLVGMYLTGNNTVTREISTAWKVLQSALRAKNPDLIMNIHFSENFLIYVAAIFAQLIILTALSWIFMAFIKRINPIIKQSIELREYCRHKGYSNEEDDLFLVCKAGLLARISESDGDTLYKDKHLWKILNKIPKDPVESQKDRNIVFIGNGFQLQRYEFKIS